MSDSTEQANDIRSALGRGTVIPAQPLALDSQRRLDEQRQRALCRYYLAAGAGGIAVGVHTTQFAIRDAKHGLLEPVWTIAAEELDDADSNRSTPLVRVAGICGDTKQAVAEAEIANRRGFHLALLNLGSLPDATDHQLLDHCRAVAEVMPLFGFYLSPAVGGRTLSYRFWKSLLELDRLWAIKVACFNRYQTIDVVRAVAESGREDVALYTGNDDNIVADLITPFRFRCHGEIIERRFVGGLLGHWAVWTHAAVQLHDRCRRAVEDDSRDLSQLIADAAAVTDMNAALFDVAHDFAGVIPGVHEVLRRQGLLAGTWCLDPDEQLSPGQADQITRVTQAYPHLIDDAFVAEHRDDWFR